MAKKVAKPLVVTRQRKVAVKKALSVPKQLALLHAQVDSLAIRIAKQEAATVPVQKPTPPRQTAAPFEEKWKGRAIGELDLFHAHNIIRMVVRNRRALAMAMMHETQ